MKPLRKTTFKLWTENFWEFRDKNFPFFFRVSCSPACQPSVCVLLNDAPTLCRVPTPANSPSWPHRAARSRSFPLLVGTACRVPSLYLNLSLLWMASSSAERDATRAPPPPDKLAAFYKLADKKAFACVLLRHARAVELAAQASVDAVALFGGDLVVAGQHMSGCTSVNSSAFSARGAEQEALLRRSRALLLLAVPILLRRIEANTLLPGSLREEELEYDVHVQAVVKKAKNEPVPPPAILQESASAMGYNVLLCAVIMCLHHLMHAGWTVAERRSVEAFVLRALDVIPRTAEMHAGLTPYEADVVSLMEQYMNTRHFEPAFCASVLRKWRSEAVSSVLRARGMLQTGVADYNQSEAEFYARQRADIAKHGLRDCALPSCSKMEKTVKEFAGCSGCRSVVYCCLEHQALDWRAHKKACREKEAARQAEEAAEEGTDGGAAAG